MSNPLVCNPQSSEENISLYQCDLYNFNRYVTPVILYFWTDLSGRPELQLELKWCFYSTSQFHRGPVWSYLGQGLLCGHQPQRQRKVGPEFVFTGFKIINLKGNLFILKPFIVWIKRNKLEGTGHVPPASLMLFLPVSLWWRHRYAALLTSLMAKDCRYLLDSLLYNPELYPGNNEAFSNNHAYFVRKIMEYFCLSCLRASLFCAWWASPQPVWWVLLKIVKVVKKKQKNTLLLLLY